MPVRLPLSMPHLSNNLTNFDK